MSRAKRLEEILEECVTAHFEGRRSLEESLSLYPGLRSELEPLLRTAIRLKSTFQTTAPSAAAQQRGLARFLSDARARRNLKTFRRQSPPGWIANFFAPRYRMGLGAVAAGVAITAVAVGLSSMGGGGGDNPNALANVTATAAPQTPAAVQNLQSKIDVIRTHIAAGQTVDPADLEQLSQATRNLQTISPDGADATHVAPVIQDADDLLDTIVSTQPVTPEVQDAIDAVRDVAGGFGIDLDATPTATPEPTSVGPTTPPSTEPTEEPSSQTTETPTPATTGVPTASPEPRGVPGFSP